ncbi:MAG: hemolytic enterotoxin [Cyanobacteria bacterium P01_A01_bin.40]
MENPTIQTDIAQILNKLDTKIDKLDEKIDDKFNKLDEKINKLEIGQAEIKGEIKALETKTEQLSLRVANQEFTNRGVLIGLILALLGGAVKLFGWMPNP